MNLRETNIEYMPTCTCPGADDTGRKCSLFEPCAIVPEICRFNGAALFDGDSCVAVMCDHPEAPIPKTVPDCQECKYSPRGYHDISDLYEEPEPHETTETADPGPLRKAITAEIAQWENEAQVEKLAANIVKEVECRDVVIGLRIAEKILDQYGFRAALGEKESE